MNFTEIYKKYCFKFKMMNEKLSYVQSKLIVICYVKKFNIFLYKVSFVIVDTQVCQVSKFFKICADIQKYR